MIPTPTLGFGCGGRLKLPGGRTCGVTEASFVEQTPVSRIWLRVVTIPSFAY